MTKYTLSNLLSGPFVAAWTSYSYYSGLSKNGPEAHEFECLVPNW